MIDFDNIPYSDRVLIDILLADDKYDSPSWKGKSISAKIQWLTMELAAKQALLDDLYNEGSIR